MTHNTGAFRERYRAGISPRYSGPLHALWVASVGIMTMVFAATQLHDVAAVEWLVLLFTLLLGNIGEYSIHKKLGHQKLSGPAKLFYQRHTGDHHSFFTEHHMLWSSTRDWRVVLFPGWLILVVIGVIGLPGYFAFGSLVSANAGALWLAGIVGTYLLYELVHFSDHLPDGHWLHRLVPGLSTMAALHRMHHDRSQMTDVNFNLTFPLTDLVMGTLRWPDRVKPPQ